MHPLIGAGLVATVAWLLDDGEEKRMAELQKQFEAFHGRIQLDDADEKAKLRGKRDMLLEALKQRLPSDVPKFECFLQGSYAMNTGTKPMDVDYDIDVGLIFDCPRSKYPDPVILKKKVRDALLQGARTVKIRRSCVTVQYQNNGEPAYHVDLAIYAQRTDGKLDIAKGKENSKDPFRVWELSDPKGLKDRINGQFSGEDLAQYRRCIRYLKRWRDVQFSSGAPLSIALTAAAFHWFRPYQSFFVGNYSDLLAIRNWVKAMLEEFSSVMHDNERASRIKIQLPVNPTNDLMADVSNIQMNTFKQKLEKLHQALAAANQSESTDQAIKDLEKLFGPEFSA
jgi:hypothetical protein